MLGHCTLERTRHTIYSALRDTRTQRCPSSAGDPWPRRAPSGMTFCRVFVRGQVSVCTGRMNKIYQWEEWWSLQTNWITFSSWTSRVLIVHQWEFGLRGCGSPQSPESPLGDDTDWVRGSVGGSSAEAVRKESISRRRSQGWMDANEEK